MMLKRNYWYYVYHHMTVKNSLLALVLISVLWNEYLSYSFAGLFWSRLYPQVSDARHMRVLLVADPQLVGLRHESDSLGFITRWDGDTYMRRTFKRALSHVEPDVVIYLGDLIDEGSEASAVEYSSYMGRFHSVFATPDHVKSVYIPGDNDVGGEGWDSKEPWKVKRFKENFLSQKQQNLPQYPDNVKFVDFLKLNWDDNEAYDSSVKEAVRSLVSSSAARYRVILNHMGILERSRFKYHQLLMDSQVKLIITAHTHLAKIITCLDCYENPKDIGGHRWMGEVSSVKDNTLFHINLSNQVSLTEIVVPTCSYRMGVSQIGYGAAIIEENGSMEYTVLWTPHRYRQLYSYLILLAIVVVVTTYCLALRLFSSQQQYGKLPH